jgi:CRP-like cAMP-binding protein
VLVRELQTSGSVYLIITGSARSYYLQDGIEVHTWFAFEGELAGSLSNFNDLPSRETIELLEPSTVLVFDIKALKRLMTENLQVAHFVHAAILEHALYLEDRIYRTHLRSASERLSALLEHEPEILRRVPLTFIASFLGISRETLSRIRSK